MAIQSLIATADIHQALRDTNGIMPPKISMQPLETQVWVTPRAGSLSPTRTIQYLHLHNRELLLSMAASGISPAQNLEKDRVPDSSSQQAYCCLKQQLCAFMKYCSPPDSTRRNGEIKTSLITQDALAEIR